MRSRLEIFVPGRLCLFGEHSDWAAEYRCANSGLSKGFTLVVGTNQGLYARVETHPDALVIRSTMPDGEVRTSREIPMEREALLREAEAGGFFSYAAGVAFRIRSHHPIGPAAAYRPFVIRRLLGNHGVAWATKHPPRGLMETIYGPATIPSLTRPPNTFRNASSAAFSS